MPSEQFEQRLRQRLEGAELQPRPQAWEGVRARLAGQRRRRFGFFWLPDLLAGALLLFAASQPPQAAPPVQASASPAALPAPDSCAPLLLPDLADRQETARSTPSNAPLAALPPAHFAQSEASRPASAASALPAATALVAASLSAGSPLPAPVAEDAARSALPSAPGPPARLRGLPLRAFALSMGQDLLPPRAAGAAVPRCRGSLSFYLRREDFLPTGGLPYAYGRVEANLTPEVSSQYPGAVYSFVLPGGQTAGGLRLGWDLRPWLRLQGGLGLAVSDTGRIWRGLLASVPVADDEFSGGLPPFYAQASNPEMIRFREYRAELPLRLQFRLPLGARQHLAAGLGLEGQYRLALRSGTSARNLNEDSPGAGGGLDLSADAIRNPANEALLRFRRAGLRLWGGLGYEYKIGPRLSFFASPGLFYDARRLYGGPAAENMPRFRLSGETGLIFYW